MCVCPLPAVPRALNVTLVLQCERWRFVRVGLAVPLLGTVAELREMVAREGRVPPDQVTAGAGGWMGTGWGTPDTSPGDTEGAGRCPAGDPGRGVVAGLPALPGRRGGAGSCRRGGAALRLPAALRPPRRYRPPARPHWLAAAHLRSPDWLGEACAALGLVGWERCRGEVGAPLGLAGGDGSLRCDWWMGGVPGLVGGRCALLWLVGAVSSLL